VELDDERRAAMVSNLMVVLCGEAEVHPVINTGTSTLKTLAWPPANRSCCGLIPLSGPIWRPGRRTNSAASTARSNTCSNKQCSSAKAAATRFGSGRERRSEVMGERINRKLSGQLGANKYKSCYLVRQVGDAGIIAIGEDDTVNFLSEIGDAGGEAKGVAAMPDFLKTWYSRSSAEAVARV